VPSTSTAQPRGNFGHAGGEIASVSESASGHARRLHEAVHGLRSRTPELSAATGLWAWQRRALAGLLMALCVGVVLAPETTLIALLAIMAVPFLCVVVLRTVALWQLTHPLPKPSRAPALPDVLLPLYTVLVPLFRETGVVPELLASLRALDYPPDRLEVMFAVEQVDEETQVALAAAALDPHMQILVVPEGEPRTKPRAIQYALQFAQGDYVVVFDAEDEPEPDQLRRALAALRAGGDRIGCLQAQLNIYNSGASWFTRQFTIEYTALFDCILPALERLQLPVPLGGTSNHFPRAVLDAIRGWDPYNVTEDADLGLRFARLGLTTTMLESTTGEEANSQVVNWLRQRSRWSKGYMQTVLVHTRRPWRLLRELGVKGTTVFLLTIGGAFVTALLAPVFWILLLLWGFFQPEWIAALFPGPVYYAASVSLVAGNFALVFLSLGAAVSRGHDDLAPHALLIPCYWALMSAAAYLALIELFVRPYHWHKTEHGLHVAEEPA
jgi:glycosyltransferase XagB